MAARARDWQKQWSIAGEVRGLGAMQAIELVRSRDTREPAVEETKRIARYCCEHGLIVLSAGTYSNVIRLLMGVLDAAFEAVGAGSRECEGVVV